MDNFGAASVKSSYSSYTIQNMVPKFHQFHEWQRYDTDFSFINFRLNLDDDIFSRIFELFPPIRSSVSSHALLTIFGKKKFRTVACGELIYHG